MPKQMRYCFASMCLNAYNFDPVLIWEEFKN